MGLFGHKEKSYEKIYNKNTDAFVKRLKALYSGYPTHDCSRIIFRATKLLNEIEYRHLNECTFKEKKDVDDYIFELIVKLEYAMKEKTIKYFALGIAELLFDIIDKSRRCGRLASNQQDIRIMLFRKRHADKKDRYLDKEMQEEAVWDDQPFYTSAFILRESKKHIDDLEKREREYIESAAKAKLKGYTDIYDKLLSFIRIIRAKKLFINEVSIPLELPPYISNGNSEQEAFISRIKEEDIKRDIDSYIDSHRELLKQENGIESLKTLLSE